MPFALRYSTTDIESCAPPQSCINIHHRVRPPMKRCVTGSPLEDTFRYVLCTHTQSYGRKKVHTLDWSQRWIGTRHAYRMQCLKAMVHSIYHQTMFSLCEWIVHKRILVANNVQIKDMRSLSIANRFFGCFMLNRWLYMVWLIWPT